MALFADMSGLKVNFHKSLLVGINIGDSLLIEAASILNCKVGKIPFLYLGLSIGGDPRRLSFWSLSLIWGSLGPSQVCPDLASCLCFFLLQGSVRYNLYS